MKLVFFIVAAILCVIWYLASVPVLVVLWALGAHEPFLHITVAFDNMFKGDDY
jgi:hypothetical protein